MRLRIARLILLTYFLLPVLSEQAAYGQLREKDLGYAFEQAGFLTMPGAITYDTGRHRLAVADRGRNLIYIFDLTERTYQTLGEREAIDDISDIAFDQTGALFIVAESAPLILRYANDTDYSDTIALGEIPSERPLKPCRIFIDASGLRYICDRESAVIYVLNPDNTLLFRINKKLKRPDGVIARQSGEILVADKGVDPILVFSPQGEFKRKLSRPEAATGLANITASGLALDQRGWIYTLDMTRSKVIWYDPTGVNHGDWGEPSFFPEDIAIDRYDNIYISERGSGRVRIFGRVG